MSKSNSCNEQLDLSELVTRMSESLTDIQWYVLERLIIDGDTLGAIGGQLGVAIARVSHIEDKALAELNKIFHEEIECFSMKLEKLLLATGGTLTVKECLVAFSEINETEFIILFAVCQNNRKGMFCRENELILLKNF